MQTDTDMAGQVQTAGKVHRQQADFFFFFNLNK
jgi:hypothetical protein